MGALEPRLAAQLLRRVLDADPAEDREADQTQDADRVLCEAEHVPMSDDGDGPVRVAGEEDAERLDVDRQQDEERVHDERVRDAGQRPLEQPLLAEDLDVVLVAGRDRCSTVSSQRSGAG